MFEALGFIVNLPPFHAEKFGQHTFDKVVAKSKLAGDLTAGGGEAHMAVRGDANQTVLFQTAHGHGNGGRRDFEPVREAGGDDRFSFTLSLEDGFEIIFFRDSNHLREIIRLGINCG